MKNKKIIPLLLTLAFVLAAIFSGNNKVIAEETLPGRPEGDLSSYYLIYEQSENTILMTFDSFSTGEQYAIMNTETGIFSNVRNVKRYTLTDGAWVLKDKGAISYTDMSDVTYIYGNVNVKTHEGTNIFAGNDLSSMKRNFSVELDGNNLVLHVNKESYIIDRTHTAIGLSEQSALTYGDNNISQANDGPRLTSPTFLETDSYGIKTASSYWYSPNDNKVYVTAGNNITNYTHTVFSRFVNINQGFNNGKWSILQNQGFSEYSTGVAKSSYFFITVIDLNTMTYSKGATESLYGKNDANLVWNQSYAVPDNLVYMYSNYEIAGYEIPYLETVKSNMEITYTQPDTYIVTVPAIINVSDKISEYDISSTGNISNSKELNITVNEPVIELTSTNSNATVTIEFRTSEDGEASSSLASFINAVQDGYVAEEVIGNNTYNKSVTRCMIVTTENIPAGNYTGTCVFSAELNLCCVTS